MVGCRWDVQVFFCAQFDAQRSDCWICWVFLAATELGGTSAWSSSRISAVQAASPSNVRFNPRWCSRSLQHLLHWSIRLDARVGRVVCFNATWASYLVSSTRADLPRQCAMAMLAQELTHWKLPKASLQVVELLWVDISTKCFIVIFKFTENRVSEVSVKASKRNGSILLSSLCFHFPFVKQL